MLTNLCLFETIVWKHWIVLLKSPYEYLTPELFLWQIVFHSERSLLISTRFSRLSQEHIILEILRTFRTYHKNNSYKWSNKQTFSFFMNLVKIEVKLSIWQYKLTNMKRTLIYKWISCFLRKRKCYWWRLISNFLRRLLWMVAQWYSTIK